MRSMTFYTNELYHIYNRGVDKRKIFLDEEDHLRLFNGLKVFNTDKMSPDLSFTKRLKQKHLLNSNLVNIHQFALLPNHFHLLVRQRVDGGISKFLHKLSTGYAKYFNRKYLRPGRLLESTFKAKHVHDERYLEHLTRYIHLNPLDLIGERWKSKAIDENTSRKFLRTYPWSSMKYYSQRNNMNRLDFTLLRDLFSSPREHENYLFEYQPFERITDDDFFQ